MPLVRIELMKGKSTDFKKLLSDIVHNALVNCIKIDNGDRRQRICEFDEENFEHLGRSRDYIIIEITMFKGRSKEAKRFLFAEIAAELTSKLAIDGNDVTIVIHEPALENWGIRGGKPASEVLKNHKFV